MDSNKDNILKAFDLWESFKKDILYKNRFIVNHEILDFLKYFAEKNPKNIEEGTILFRARPFTGDSSFLYYLNNEFHNDDAESESAVNRLGKLMKEAEIKFKSESGFWGFNKNDSFIPPSNDYVADGRANPAFITYLYTAEQPYTALVEVRPYLGSRVSIAEIEVKESFIIADFSYESLGSFMDEKLEYEQMLLYFIMKDFSAPTDSNKKDYIPIQYIAEFIKNLGYEGIRFNSSLYSKGRNITIFNYDKCEPVGSKLYEIEDICFEAKGIAPKNEKSLIHEKLLPYKQKNFFDFLTNLKTNKRDEI
jgi:hypothetical protein